MILFFPEHTKKIKKRIEIIAKLPKRAYWTTFILRYSKSSITRGEPIFTVVPGRGGGLLKLIFSKNYSTSLANRDKNGVCIT